MRIHIFALLLFLHSFVACQQSTEKIQPAAASVVFQSAAPSHQCAGKAQASATNVIFQSVDGGQTWNDISEGLPEKLSASRVFAGNNEVFLCAEKGLYHTSSTSIAPVWENEVFKDIEISDIFFGQTGPYISSYRKGFFKNIMGTGLLEPMHNNLEDKTVRAIMETPDGTVFVGCESGIFKSADGGNCWKHVFTESGVNSLVAAEDVLICATYKGLLRSTDGGEHWDWVLTEDGSAYKTGYMNGRFVTVTSGARTWQEEVNAKGLTNKLRTSTDGGKTWQRMDESLASGFFISGMGVNMSPIKTIHDIKQAGEYLFCSCDTGIFRSSDWGKNWEPVFPYSGDKLIHLAVSGHAIYAVMVVGC